MTFAISKLPERELRALRANLASLGRDAGETGFVSVDEIQSAYDALLAGRGAGEERRFAVGVAFGEMICAHGDFEWVYVEDEYGSGPALAPIGFNLVCSAIDMIEGRLDDGEAVDLVALCADTIATIERIIEAGDAGLRQT